LPIDPSSLTRWRKRIGEEGVETLLMASIDAARRGQVLKASSAHRVIIDTTVMPKAVAHPTDSQLPERSRQHLVKAASEHDLSLRQNYNRTAPKLAAQIGRYAHARQFKRMHRAVRTLRTRVGRIHREIQRQLHKLPEQAGAKVQELLQRTGRILSQRKQDKNKLYALHAPEVECIAKGKARTPYEFGVKVSVATTFKEGLVVGMRSMPGNPYDGHTLAQALEQVGIVTGSHTMPGTVIVDKGYRGVEIQGVRILRWGQRRGMTRTLRAMIKRRSAIEPAIGHMKMDGWLGRNRLKGVLGDALHAVMCGAGHNLRLILAALRLYCARFRLLLAVVLARLVEHLRSSQPMAL